MMIDWHIQSRSRACCECGRSFEDKQRYYTYLYETREGFDRTDVCTSCWEEQFQHGAADRKGFVSHWQGVFLMPPPPQPDAIRKDTAEDLLYRLSSENSPDRQDVLFILAVMLERKKQLKVREKLTVDGKKVTVYEHVKKGDTFTVIDPELKLDQLEPVQKEVAQLLENGLIPSVTESTDPVQAEAPIPSDEQEVEENKNQEEGVADRS